MESEKDTVMKEVTANDGVASEGEDEEDDVVVIVDGSGSGGANSTRNSSKAASKRSADRVKRPWSQEEDAILCEQVSNFGPKNWSLIARGIPGRSGKSCRHRWCNQLDPAVMRKPFTDEEDSIILQAHAAHGNKWALIARLLPGRTDNAIKNHWHSSLSRRCTEPGKFKLDSSTILKDVSAENSKASSDEALSCGDVNSLMSSEGKDVSSEETMNDEHHENKTQTDGKCSPEPTDPSSLFCPTARISAFNIHGSVDEMETSLPLGRLANFEAPLQQLSKPDIGITNLLQTAYGDRLVPHQCGHCWFASPGTKECRNSLLGPEFADYAEPPSFPSHELATLTADISNVAWNKSGLANSSIRTMDNASSRAIFSSSHLQLGPPNESRRNGSLEEGQYRSLSMTTDAMSPPLSWLGGSLGR